jgi:hypothetical protein
MANRRASRPENPLDAYLRSIGGPFDSLSAYEATQLSKEKVPVTALRRYLRKVLQNVKYPHPARLEQKKSFYQVLQDANVLLLLMSRDSITEIWKCFLVKEVASAPEFRRKTGSSPSGQVLSFHAQMRSEIRRHLKAVTKLAEMHPDPHNVAKGPMATYRATVEREYNRHASWILLNRNSGNKQSLLRAATYSATGKTVRDVDLATQIALFRFLKWLLSNQSSKKKGISDLFLRLLAQVIDALRNLTVAEPTAENLRKAIERLNLKKSRTFRRFSSQKNT